MSNVDDGSGTWQFIVRRVPGGVGHRDALRQGRRWAPTITLDGPYGLAYLRPESPRDLVLHRRRLGPGARCSRIARGAVREPKLDGRRIHVFYGARTHARPLRRRRALRRCPGFGERASPSRRSLSHGGRRRVETWNGATGFVHEIARDFVGERWADFEYYFAGPPPMAEAVQQMLIEKRVPYPQVHFDSFY